MGETIFMESTRTDRSTSGLDELFAALPAVVCEFDLDLRLIRYNRDSQQNFSGVHPSFLEGRKLQDLLLEKESKYAFLTHLKSAVESGLTCSFETIHDSGKHAIQVKTHCSPIKSSSGNIIGLTTMCTSTRLDQQLSSVAQKSVFDAMGNVVIRVDENGKILYSNKPFFGLPKDSIVGTHLDDYFFDDERTIVKAASLRIFADGTPLSFSVSLNSTGTPKWFTCMASPIVLNGEVPEAILMFHEISGMRARLGELEDELSLYSGIMSNINDGVMALDEHGRVTAQNAASKRILGANFEHIREIEGLMICYADTKDLMSLTEFPLLKALSGEACDDVKLVLRDPENKVNTHISMSTRPLKSTSGDVVGAVACFHDDTLATKSHAQLKEANESLDYFVQATAHDLKAPVDNMKNLIGLMERVTDPAKRQVFEEKLKASVHKLDDLLGALMEMVDVQKNDHRHIDQLNLQDTFDFIAQDLSEDLTNVQAVVNTDFSKAPEVLFNKAQLRSLFQNMLTNSLKYRDHSRLLEVEVTSEKIGDYVVIHFTDNGIGIDLERHGKDLFKPFKRLSNQGEGKGIGLNLIKSFVDRNGGEIKVESEKGQGTTFHVFLKSEQID